MKRVVSLMLIAALLSVSGLPLLPTPAACAHGVELMEDCGDCHEGMDHGMTMKHGMEQGAHHDTTSHQHGKYDKKLSPTEKECRIECGCGCNASLDGLPHQLAPHSPSVADIELLKPENNLAITAVPVLASYTVLLSTPPPKSVFSQSI